MPDKKNLPEIYLQYLEKYTAMSVSTLNADGTPDCSTVYYAYSRSGRICFASDKNTAKSRNLQNNNKCAVTMNDGGASAMGVKVLGVANEITGQQELEAARKAILGRIPSIKPFFDNPNLVMYNIVPEKRYVINFSWGIDWKLEVE